MAQPGWYPDPAGTPGRYRYWDGAQWSETTTDDPATPPPGAAPSAPAPPPPPAAPTQAAPTPRWPTSTPTDQSVAGYGDIPPPPGPPPGGFTGGLSPMPPTSGATRENNTAKFVLVGVAVLGVLLLLGLSAFLGFRLLGGDSSKDDGRSGEPRTTATADPSPTGPESTEEELPEDEDGPPVTEAVSCLGGSPLGFDDGSDPDRIISSGISMPRLPGYEYDLLYSTPFTWAYEVMPQVQVVSEGWLSMYAVGGVPTSFGTPQEAAHAVMECMAPDPNFYRGYTHHDDVTSAAIDVAGARAAWSYVADIHINSADIDEDGDRAQVIVVDTGDPELYGMYISVVPLADEARYSEQEATAGELRAE